MRQLAWYSVVPRKAETTRAEQAKAEGMPLLLPPAGDAAYLVAHLFEVGPLGWAGMGEVPVSHVDIQAWQSNVGIQLQAWEARALRRLSAAYVEQLGKSRDPACVAPWAPAKLPDDARTVVHNKVKSAFAALSKISIKTGAPRHARRNR